MLHVCFKTVFLVPPSRSECALFTFCPGARNLRKLSGPSLPLAHSRPLCSLGDVLLLQHCSCCLSPTRSGECRWLVVAAMQALSATLYRRSYTMPTTIPLGEHLPAVVCVYVLPAHPTNVCNRQQGLVSLLLWCWCCSFALINHVGRCAGVVHPPKVLALYYLQSRAPFLLFRLRQ